MRLVVSTRYPLKWSINLKWLLMVVKGVTCKLNMVWIQSPLHQGAARDQLMPGSHYPVPMMMDVRGKSFTRHSCSSNENNESTNHYLAIARATRWLQFLQKGSADRGSRTGLFVRKLRVLNSLRSSLECKLHDQKQPFLILRFCSSINTLNFRSNYPVLETLVTALFSWNWQEKSIYDLNWKTAQKLQIWN